MENTQKSENCQSSSDLDPSMMSMDFLQEAQEGLENELLRLGEIEEQDGNDGQFEEVDSCSSLIPETQLFELNKKVKHLESKLHETLATVKAMERKVWELELVLQERDDDVKCELEVLLKKKMEAEFEYLILRSSPDWKIVSEDHIALLNQLRYLAGDQEQMMLKLKDAEDKTIRLSEWTDKLGAYSKELVGIDYILRMNHMVCKFSFYFMFQLMLLCFSFGLVLMKLMFPADGVVPT